MCSLQLSRTTTVPTENSRHTHLSENVVCLTENVPTVSICPHLQLDGPYVHICTQCPEMWLLYTVHSFQLTNLEKHVQLESLIQIRVCHNDKHSISLHLEQVLEHSVSPSGGRSQQRSKQVKVKVEVKTSRC